MTEPTAISAEALSSVHTRNFPGLLQRLKSSLLISALERAGMLIVVRSEDEELHTDFVALNQPMGMAVDSRRLVVGGWDRVYEFRNMPAFSAGFAPLEGHDAVYLCATCMSQERTTFTRSRSRARSRVVRQHALLVPVHARPGAQLRAALAAAVRYRLCARRSVPSERSRAGRRSTRGSSLRSAKATPWRGGAPTSATAAW